MNNNNNNNNNNNSNKRSKEFRSNNAIAIAGQLIN